jgi:hypothetical protein
VSEWKPIDSAPKDGTQILAFAKDAYGYNYYGVAEWAVDGPGKIQPHVEDWFWPFAIRPTAWMPLPEPPQ